MVRKDQKEHQEMLAFLASKYAIENLFNFFNCHFINLLFTVAMNLGN